MALALACLASVALSVWLHPNTAEAGRLPALLDSDWIIVRTPHFTIKSMLRKADSVEIARELELFRQLVLRFTNVETDASAVHNEILILKRQSGLKKLGVEGRGLVGIFSPGIRNNVIVMAKMKGFAQHVIQHEFVHFLFGQTTGKRYPMWYGEGFAEFMASSKIERNTFTFGDVPDMRVDPLQYGPWVPFRRLIDRRQVQDLNQRERGMLYAQSWLLVHYLQLGRPGRNLLEDMKAYRSHLERRVADVDAFEAAFGLKVDSLRSLLVDYVNSGDIKVRRIPLESFDLDIETTTHAANRAEMAVVLARTIMHLTEKDLEVPYVEYALRANPPSASALATSGVSLDRRGRVDEAYQQLVKALELAPKDPYVVLDMGEHWLRRARAEGISAKIRSSRFAKARRYFVRAWKLDSTIPEVFAMYGRTYLAEGSRPDKALEMLEEAARLLPSSLEIRYELALAHRNAGNGLEAQALARSIVASGHGGDSYGKQALDLLRELAAVCTPMLYAAFHADLRYGIYVNLLEASRGSARGSAKLSVEINGDGSIRKLGFGEVSSEEFRQRVQDAVRASVPFSSFSPAQYQCFGGMAHAMEFEVDEQYACDNDDMREYALLISQSMRDAIHRDTLLAEPGSGRILVSFRVSEVGEIQALQLGDAAETLLGKKVQRALSTLAPFGVRPGASSCWNAPQWLTFDVIGSDTPLEP